ncbi:MAG: DUF6090 family protein [Bacteroidota bacterium]
MAKFFQKIRKKLLSENKFGKYLTYAIGEIILVVIGILIALQVNNMNQNNQLAKLESSLLDQIRFELLDIYEDIWRDAERLELGNTSHYLIQDYIDQDLSYSDSLCFYFYWLKVDEYVYPASASYNRIKEEGLDLIKNDTIRLALQALYEGHFPRLSKVNSFTPDITSVFDSYYLNNFRPNRNFDLTFEYQLTPDAIGNRTYKDVYYRYPQKDRPYQRKFTVGYVPLNFSTLKKDPTFLMLMEQTKRYRDYKLARYLSAGKIIKLAVQTINNGLDD